MTENRRRWLWISLVVGAIVLAIALITSLLTTGGGPSKTGVAAPPTPTATATPSSTPTPTKKPKPTSLATGALGVSSPGPGFGWADPAKRHTLRIVLFSSSPVYVQIGWKAPTAPQKGGVVKAHLSSWSRTMSVYGAPQYVVFYTYYGGAEAPVTCQVFIDGSLRVTKTSSGRYGGLMCVG